MIRRLLEPPVSCGGCGGEGWVESKRPGLFRLCVCRFYPLEVA